MQEWGPVSVVIKKKKVLRLWIKRSWRCFVSVFSVVPQEEQPWCSEWSSVESRVQAEQAPLLHHHDGLQPQLLLCREGRLPQRTEGSATQEHNAPQVTHAWTTRSKCPFTRLMAVHANPLYHITFTDCFPSILSPFPFFFFGQGSWPWCIRWSLRRTGSGHERR